MKRLKKLGIFVLLMLLCLQLSACRQDMPTQADVSDDVFSVYASFYPIYALAQPLVENIEDVQLHCLVQPQDGCLRSYQLSDWDLALLAGAADAAIIGGRGLESFENTLAALGEDGPAVSAILYDMQLKNKQAINTTPDRTSHWLDDNPHIYMDVDGAANICRRIAAALAVLDPANEGDYQENLKSAEIKLQELKLEMDSALANVQGQQVIVLNEALTYADDAYGLEVALCYEREGGEDLAGNDLAHCLETLKGCNAKVILLEKQAPQSLCTALEAAGYSVAKMDVMSTRRAQEGFEGYLEAQRGNVQAILAAFASAK